MEPIKIPATNFTELEKEILSRPSNARGFTPHVIKLYYRALVTKTAWCWPKEIHSITGTEKRTQK